MAGSRRKKKEADKENHERWLITYSDLITLLMVFFVLMYSMSQVDAQKYAAVANSLSLVLNGKSLSMMDSQGPSMVDGISGNIAKEGPGPAPAEQGQLDEVKKMIEEFINTEGMQADVNSAANKNEATKLGNQIIIYEQERGLVISFKDALLFDSGSAELTPRAQGIIQQVGKPLVNIPNYIRVEGHTDDLPIKTAQYPSNWELSIMRAANVVHVLNEQAKIPASRLAVIGYGENRPLAANEDAISRAMNRRVDIVILKKKYDYFEPSAGSTAP